ncbi:MAG: trypsin-like peptidase domain-containing protein [Candidatus Riflebacteria bacterium]|nr:trypsin-like peptidase domain-containing protein [Candidatus Riflebacteria bacterium]
MKKTIISDNGKSCSVCSRAFRIGEYVVECEHCGAYTHESCFKEHGCGSEECRAISPHFERSEIILTKEEVSKVIAVPENTKNPTEYLIGELNKGEKPFSKSAIFAVAFSVFVALGTMITFVVKTPISEKAFYYFAFIGGFASLILTAISLVLFNRNKKLRGLPLAFCALFIGAMTVFGGVGNFLYLTYNESYTPVPNNKVDKKKIAQDIEKAAAHIQEPLKSNVCVKSGFGLSESMGSGVVVKNKESKTYIITNVHVLTGGSMVASLDEAKKKARNLSVTFYNAETKKAEILWVAPEGIDLALISCETPENYTSFVKIGSANDIKMGEKVFAIGNPMGLDWTYTEGVVSSFRNREIGKYEISVIQIQTPLNHGNSGGGLYSEAGNLVGINTWIYEKAKTEGLNFSIAIDELIKTLDADLLKIITE